MSALARYTSTGSAGVAGLVVLSWPWLDAPGRNGLLAAAAVALAVQVVAFGLMVRFRERPNHFLAVWVAGTLVRMAVVVVAGLALSRLPGLPPATTLLGLAGFFFGLLLLEPVFFASAKTTRPEHAR